jgi:hypothetical protein
MGYRGAIALRAQLFPWFFEKTASPFCSGVEAIQYGLNCRVRSSYLRARSRTNHRFGKKKAAS